MSKIALSHRLLGERAKNSCPVFVYVGNGTAIYTRKSKLTHMGDSTGIQMKQSADFARSQLNLPEDYCFLEYEDKGLSGYYADRPDFQRMLHDIEAGKHLTCFG